MKYTVNETQQEQRFKFFVSMPAILFSFKVKYGIRKRKNVENFPKPISVNRKKKKSKDIEDSKIPPTVPRNGELIRLRISD